VNARLYPKLLQSARRMVGAMAHVLNRPIFDPQLGRIVALSSTVGVIWLVVLALMVWQPGG